MPVTSIRLGFIGLCSSLLVAGCASHAQTKTSSAGGMSRSAAGDKYETPEPHNTMPAVMQAKLAHSQAILEGIAMADYRQVEVNANALHEISLTADWLVHDTESYYAFSDRFREATMQLVGHARAKNLDAITADYARLTQTCVACHTWLRNEKQSKDMPGKVSMR